MKKKNEKHAIRRVWRSEKRNSGKRQKNRKTMVTPPVTAGKRKESVAA